MILTISIPDDAKSLLKSGQKVHFGDPFLEDHIRYEITVEVSKKLRIHSDKIFKYLKKFVGDPVNKGELLAEKKGLIKTHTIISEYTGLIKEINHYEGNVIISTSKSQGNQVKAFFKGEVVEIIKNQLKIKVEETHEFNLKQASKNFGGQTIYLKDSSKPIFATQTASRIMVIESINAYLKAKAEALGISGFVTLKNPPQDSSLPKAQIKSIEDYKKIIHLNLPYCLIDKQFSKIYFYK
ncbi:hypothetical protein A3A46_01380 [Candidatus Roizmanbacteria bacterium RIFCSPLOWO2_01_FULL_37_13]|nr:MAG: hypothetical protein A3A46_01380 [Candidatus Roizmanbacteria bacterium RIFCSPLOWO2_01_FULL_37_13]